MIDDTLTMIPGPVPIHRRVLDALSRQAASHLSPGFVETFRTCLANLRRIAQSESALPFAFGGSGTLAMEMALVNLVAPGERVLIISQGYFGHFYAELADSFGIEYDMLRSDWGHIVPPEELEKRLSQASYAAVTITHVDTSTGACAPAGEYCRLLRGRDELVILDGVCALGGVPEPFDEWGLDALLAAPQKALGAPPGLAIVVFSQRALAKRRRMNGVPAFYADVMRWLPVMEDPNRYHSTPCVNEIVALREATELVLEEGLEERFRRHGELADRIRSGLAALGLEPFTSADCLAATLSVFRYPQSIEDVAFRKEMAARGVVVAGGLGPVAGKVFRIGHMGNIGIAEIAATLEAAEGSLQALDPKN